MKFRGQYLLSFLFIFLLPALAFSEIYEHTDSNGVASFSDRPTAGATQVEISAPQTISVPTIKSSTTGQIQTDTDVSKNNATSKPIEYKITIQSPQNEENIPTGNSADLAVSVSVTPALAQNMSISILLDGKSVATGSKTDFTLGWLDRGKHSLQAQILDKNNKIIASSATITCYIQHPNLHSLFHQPIKTQLDVDAVKKPSIQVRFAPEHIEINSTNNTVAQK